MPDYSTAKIYTVRCRTNHTLIYVGSTVERLSTRFCKHKASKSTSLSLFINNIENNTSWDEWYIELYELYPCNNREELCKREGEIIRLIATINKLGYVTNPFLARKTYYETNKENICEKAKAYYKNKPEQKEAYYAKNKAILAEKAKDYYQKHKEKIIAKQKEYYQHKKDESSGK